MTPEQIKNLFNKPYSRLLILGLIGILIMIGVLIGHRIQADHRSIEKVKEWRAKYAYLTTNLTNDFKKAQIDIQNNSTEDLASVCTQIKKDSLNAESKPAIPDGSIETNWKAGLNDDAKGGAACNDAITNSKSSEFTQASTDFTNGSKALTAANTQMKALN